MAPGRPLGRAGTRQFSRSKAGWAGDGDRGRRPAFSPLILVDRRSGDFYVAVSCFHLSHSRSVGREPWLQPYTDLTLEELARSGVRQVQVLCPGFAVDCLETLEEIAEQNRERFEEAGGEKLEYIPALNDSDAHLRLYRQLVQEAMGSE